MKNELFSIHTATKFLGITRRILLNYEKLGLITPDLRTETKYRYYSPETINRIQLVERLKHTGLSLKTIKAYLDNTIDREKEIDNLRLKVATIDNLIRLLSYDLGTETIHFETVNDIKYLAYIDDFPIKTALEDALVDLHENFINTINAGLHILKDSFLFFFYKDHLHIENNKIRLNRNNEKYYCCCPITATNSKNPHIKEIHIHKGLLLKFLYINHNEKKIIKTAIEEIKASNMNPKGNIYIFSETGPIPLYNQANAFIINVIIELE